MTMLLELPPTLEEELTQEAEKIGLPADEHVRLLLWIVSALVYQPESNPLSEAVRELLAEQSVDPNEFGRLVGALVQSVQPGKDGGVDGVLVEGGRTWILQAKEHRVSEPSGVRRGSVERPSAMGKYAHLNWSSDGYARRKQEEIDLEDGGAA
jgi:hypothetical protein